MSYLDITISANSDYALVLFDNVQDCVTACHTLLACNNRQWALDFQPVEDRVHLKIRYHRWQTIRRQATNCFVHYKLFRALLTLILFPFRDESNVLRLISQLWDRNFSSTDTLHSEQAYLYNELNQIRRELSEADDALAKLVFQAARQAITQMQRDSQSMDIINLGVYFEHECESFPLLLGTPAWYS